MVSAVLLASDVLNLPGAPAGESVRLETMIGALHSARILDCVYVTRGQGGAVSRIDSLHTAILLDTGRGEIGALLEGIALLEQEHLHGVVACRLDSPDLTQALLVDLLQGFWRSKKKIVRSSSMPAGESPVIFSRTMFDALRTAPSTATLNDILREHPDDIYDISLMTTTAAANTRSIADTGDDAL